MIILAIKDMPAFAMLYNIAAKWYVCHILPGEVRRFVFLAILNMRCFSGAFSSTHLLTRIMKTSCLLRNILLAGSISLTLASCGGGGGGGGETSSSGNDSTTNTPSTQKGYAPYNLTGCTMTYWHDGKLFTFEFGNSGRVEGIMQHTGSNIQYEGSYSYSRSAGGQGATLKLNTTSGTTSAGITKKQTFAIELTFSSNTKAIAKVDYTNSDSVNENGFYDKDDSYSVVATFSGDGVQDNGASDGESNDDSSSDESTQLAPETLSVGTVINLHASGGSISSYTVYSTTNCTSNSGSKLTWEYSVTGNNTAEFVTKNTLNIPYTTKMVFTSATKGSYTRHDAGGKVIASGSFNLSDKSDAPSQSDEDDDKNNDDDTTGNTPSKIPALAKDDFTPNSLEGCTLVWKNKTFRFGANGKMNSPLSSNETYTYRYIPSSRYYAEIVIRQVFDGYPYQVFEWTFKIEFESKADKLSYERCSGISSVKEYSWIRGYEPSSFTTLNSYVELIVPYVEE